MRLTNRAPAAWLAIDIAGIGENPNTRSGPCASIVWTWAAEISSMVSGHEARTRPPLPRAFW